MTNAKCKSVEITIVGLLSTSILAITELCETANTVPQKCSPDLFVDVEMVYVVCGLQRRTKLFLNGGGGVNLFLTAVLGRGREEEVAFLPFGECFHL